MRLSRASCGRALLCLFLLSGVTAAGAHHPKRQETTRALSSPDPTSTDNGQATTPLPTSSAGLDDITASLSLSSSRPTLSTQTQPSPTSNAGSNFFNATIPEGQLPLEPQITPGWAVAGTILLVTGIVYALFGIRAQRVHTFFSAAFLAALGTTVLVLYLMTPPATLAVQGAYVVAAVCTGAALGGLAVLFNDLAECLGCLLGGFSLSMWLLTLHPGGLVPSASGKMIFIAVFTIASFCLYFSRWTRTHGLMACISFSGSTAAVLGIDCFTRAGLKEFWAYIWALNDKMFPDGAVTYPLTRGIRVELAVIILLFVVGIISQLKLWRLMQNRRNNSTDAPVDEELGLPDDEEKMARELEEATNRERREWERMYGDGGSAPAGSSDSAVGDMESEKPEGYSKRTSATSATALPDGELPADPSKAPPGQAIREKDGGDGRVVVRVVEEDSPEGDAADGSIREKGEGYPQEDPATSTTRRNSQSEPAVVPLPFKIPTPKQGKNRGSVAASDEEDGSSVAAVADEENEPTALTRGRPFSRLPGVWRNSVSIRRAMARRSTDTELERSVAGERDGPPTKTTRNDSDSVIAAFDDESTSGDAETSILDWSSRRPEGKHNQAVAAASRDVAPLDALGAPSLDGPESAESFRTRVARLTKVNLPPALPNIALTYRTNEWAKHLGVAETPEWETLQLPKPIPEAPEEEPAHLNIVELQQTAENGAPPPAAPRIPSAMSSYASHQRSNSKTSMSSSEMAGFAPSPDLHMHRSETAQSHHLPASLSVLDLSQPAAPNAHRPQTLIGIREKLLRYRASGIFLPFNNETMHIPTTDHPPSDAGSIRNHRPSPDVDLDDLPLSQRRVLIRREQATAATVTADSTAFDSHQPARHSNLPSASAREAQLAHFRHLVAADLRAASPVAAPITNSLRRIPSSTTTLLGGLGGPSTSMLSFHSTAADGGDGITGGRGGGGAKRSAMLRSIDMQRSILLGQKEAEAQRKVAALAEKVRYQREFEECMRSGALMSAHRDAMRRLQGGVNC
ncbi:hypothetical protein C8A00DRAFT_15057 [Chaetomidium leptoderma]|uniref:TM7S3/TM198-like domain-containing protein n=1 Tax=Chaetomidium leptoderma TaxID=669021 RepID=A0AAN6ZXG2_9PEZI|nr:hypothetical protein C8A00DRAFT_15057 [Chaetomidium leptoderma]